MGHIKHGVFLKFDMRHGAIYRYRHGKCRIRRNTNFLKLTSSSGTPPPNGPTRDGTHIDAFLITIVEVMQ